MCLLEGGVLLHVAHAAHHLGEIVGREDEHELVLHRAVLAHIDHCLGIALLLDLEFLLQLDDLGVEGVDGGIERHDVAVEAVDGLLLPAYLMVKHQHAVKTCLDILIELGKLCL